MTKRMDSAVAARHTRAVDHHPAETATTEDLLAEARSVLPDRSDPEILAAGLRSLIAAHRLEQQRLASPAEIDRQYERAYTEHPLDEPDEWGDLASFARAIAASTGRSDP